MTHECLLGRYASPDRLLGEDAYLYLCHIEPRGMRGSMVERDAIHDFCGLFFAECFDERCLEVRIEIIENDMNLARVPISGEFDEAFDFVCEIGLCSPFRYSHFPMPAFGLHGHKDIPCAVAFILIVPLFNLPFFGWSHGTCVFQELFGFFIKAQDRLSGIMRFCIQIKNLFHASLKFRRN